MITTVHSSIDERIYLKEAVSLVQSGYKVSIIGNHPGEETLQHVKFYPLPQTKNRIHRILFSPWHALRLARKIKADIYHFHDPELYPLASLLFILYRRPVIMDIHEHYGKDIMSKHWIPKRLRKIYCSIFTIIENLCLHNVRALIYVVPAIAERYQHVKRPKIEIRNCPILEAFTVAEDISIPRESTRAIYTGRLDPTNGILELVKAFALIRQETPHARLDIMGPKMTDEFYQILEKEINALDLQNTVFLRPPVPYYEMKYELFKASIGYVTLLPTSENNSIGRPNKTYEYMACKLAVISSDFPSMRKLMDESRGGLCVDPSNPVDIAEKTSSLMKNPDYCRQLGENGYQMVQTHYCWSMESQKLVSFYHNLFSSKKTNLSQ